MAQGDTKTFNAQIDSWVAKCKRRSSAVVRQATNNTIRRASRVSAGTTRGGSVKVGYVPRDLGTLAASLLSTLHGSTMLTQPGADSYRFVVTNMEVGDVATFVWTAPYARAQHYGYTTSTGKKVGGWLWVDNAANEWPNEVRRVTAIARNLP